jgi:hypothetical protein
MKKYLLLLGGLLGFLIGSRAGREPYDRLEARVHEVLRGPRTNDSIENATDVVNAIGKQAKRSGRSTTSRAKRHLKAQPTAASSTA